MFCDLPGSSSNTPKIFPHVKKILCQGEKFLGFSMQGYSLKRGLREEFSHMRSKPINLRDSFSR